MKISTIACASSSQHIGVVKISFKVCTKRVLPTLKNFLRFCKSFILKIRVSYDILILTLHNIEKQRVLQKT
jgi:hypothetical protein